MRNAVIAEQFYTAADIMALLEENAFKVSAFRKVADALQATSEDVEQLANEGRLEEIPGVGTTSAAKISEFIRTGHISSFDELRSQVPKGVVELMQIPTLGVKTVHQLWKEAGITGVAELREKTERGELAKLKGFGPGKLAKLKKGLEFHAEHAGRFRIGKALPPAEQFVAYLRGQKGVRDAHVVGDLRRGAETVKNIEILVIADEADFKTALDAAKGHPSVLGVGQESESSVELTTARQLSVYVHVSDPIDAGAAMVWRTGSEAFVQCLALSAKTLGLTLNAEGLLRGDTIVVAETEARVFALLGRPFVPPELREIQAVDERLSSSLDREKKRAADEMFADLIEITDIRGDLHCHTTASDGGREIAEVVAEAKRRGLAYIAITDHSKSQFQANGLSVERLLEHAKAVRAVGREAKDILVLAGTEVDILADGSLDYEDDVLRQLDWVVASPHAALTQDSEAATLRLVRAAQNPFVHVIGHPTGRLVLTRRGLEPDMRKVAFAAARGGCALEINSNSHRLDLRSEHVRMAIDADVYICIDTDMHDFVDFDQLRYGISTARRAGARKQNILNAMSPAAFQKWLDQRRAAQ